MRAALLDAYARPARLRIADVPEPIPRRGQLRIAVRAVSINPRDWLLCEGKYVFRHLVVGFPKIPGSDVAGVVDAVGPGATRFRVGDEVVAMQTPLGQMRGFAEKFVVDESAVGRKSERMTFEEASGLPVAGLTALQMLRDDGAVRAGETAAIIGASGGVGHYAVQLARALGATVVGVCSAASADFVRGLGAHRVVDRKREDVIAALGRVDVVIDAFGRGALDTYRPALAPGGRYVTTVPNRRNTLDALATLRPGRGGARSRTTVCRARGRDLDVLADHADAGTLRTVIDSVYPLEAVNDALARSRSFRARGKVVLRVSADH